MKHSIVKTLAALTALILTTLPLSAAEVVTYYHNDHLGSPIAATDSSGTVVWQQAYDPWGEPVTTTANDRAYTGKWRDLETGLNDYAARWQSSSIGRFTQIDNAPWHEGNIHSFNRYAYANNSPYRYKDPDGNIPVDTIWDAANVLYDGARIIYGHATGNSEVVAEASTDMAVDLGAMFVPYVPAGSSKLARMGDGAETVKKGPLHHICTNKNCVSTARGGPWTPRFEAIFEKAGMNLDDALNKIRVPGHKGPHPEAYHQAVFDRLSSATDGLNGSAYKGALQSELRAIGQEAATPGSGLNKLLTKQ